MGRIKIIAGIWRGRSIEVPEDDTVRPTLGRIRETFFSWLMPHLPGAKCLDLFAGSGALGFEALSRGASHVTFVDQDPNRLTAILAQARLFGVEDRIALHQASVPDVPQLMGQVFDCVFLDPPYDQAATLLAQSAKWLNQIQALHAGSAMVGEWGVGQDPILPDTWQCLRLKKARHLHYAYWRYGGSVF